MRMGRIGFYARNFKFGISNFRFGIFVFIFPLLWGCFSHSVAPVTATAPSAATTSPDQVYARPVDRAIADGVAFLESSQNPNGSWGTGTVTHGNEVEVSVPGSHDAFRVAVASLCVMALREAGEHEAHDRGVEFLLSHPDVRRGDAELLYNVWAHAYIVQACPSSRPPIAIRGSEKRSIFIWIGWLAMKRLLGDGTITISMVALNNPRAGRRASARPRGFSRCITPSGPGMTFRATW